MKAQNLEVGDVLQLKPDYKNGFGGMLIVCTEPKSWGCQGYLMSPSEIVAVKYKGRAYLRPKFEDMEYVGHLQWMIDKKIEE